MFWRFGSLEERRPVAATVWLKEVWILPVSVMAGLCAAAVLVGLFSRKEA